MMETIEFTGTYTGIKRNVKLMNPSGGGEGYHVYLDKYYNGTLVKLNDEWVGHMNPKCELTEAEIQRLGRIVDRYEAHKGKSSAEPEL